MRKLGTATHGVLRVIIERGEFDGIGTYSCETHNEKEGRSGEETSDLHFDVTVLEETDEKGDHVDCNHQCQVICDLLVVSLDLETEQETEQG